MDGILFVEMQTRRDSPNNMKEKEIYLVSFKIYSRREILNKRRKRKTQRLYIIQVISATVLRLLFLNFTASGLS